MEYGLAVAGDYDTVLSGARFASERGLVALALPDHYLLALDDGDGRTKVVQVGQTSDAWDNSYFDDSFWHNGTLKKYKGYC